MLQQVTATDQKRQKSSIKDGALKAEVITITPKLAEEWLGKNIKNRAISKRLVSAYARDMTAGYWRLTGEPISFNKNGDMVNGQHRLLACIQALTPFTSLVVYGVGATASLVLDAGRSRRAGDILKMNGIDNPVWLAAAANWLMCIKSGSARGQQFTRSETLACIEKHPILGESAEQIASMIGGSGFIGPFPTLLVSIHYIGAVLQKEASQAKQFVQVFATGKPTYDGDAAHAWRERLIKMKMDGLRPPRSIQMPALIYAWNLFRTRKAAGNFAVPDEVRVEAVNYKKI